MLVDMMLFTNGRRVARVHEASITPRLLAPTETEAYLGLMRIVDPETRKSYVDKRRVRFNEPGQPRELTFSCYRHYTFLARDRTREWFCEALDEARRGFATHHFVCQNPSERAPIVGGSYSSSVP